MAYSNREYVVTTGTSTYTFNATFNNADSRITCIGNGSAGGAKQSNSLAGSGGGGGACGFIVNNSNFKAGDAVSVTVQAGNAGAFDTSIKDIGATVRCSARGGTAGSGTADPARCRPSPSG